MIEKTTIPFPEIKPGDIVIKVRLKKLFSTLFSLTCVQVEYCGVNFIDTYYR